MTRGITVLAGAVILASAIWLMRSGIYGLTLFLVVPVLIGAVSATISSAQSYGQAAARGAGTVAALTCSLILIGLEGVFCIAMTLPLAAPLGALGGLIAFRLLTPSTDRAGNMAAMALIPLATLGFDTTAKPEVHQVRTAVEIAAPPARVWQHVIAFPPLPEPEQWYFRSGIAYPIRARLEGTGPGAIRYCDFSTGPFVEPIVVWDEPRLLRFSVTHNPAPMSELSPWANVVPRHLHGYFVSKQGQFRLIPQADGHTLLEGTTWYQHGLWPARYWRLWSDAIIHRIHLRVLNHIRTLSEHQPQLQQ